MSKTAKHTPGPWTVYHENGSLGSGGHYGVEAGDLPGRFKTIAVCAHGSVEKPEQRANAALIAAAPETAAERDRLRESNAELLAALVEARSVLESARQYFPSSIKNPDRFRLLNVLANAVDPAIAKAIGGAK